MKLSEILDKAAPLTTVRDNERNLVASSIIGGRKIEFRFAGWPLPNVGKYNFTFVQVAGDDEEDDDLYSDGETYDKTGRGGELAVFATAKKFLEDAIAKKKPLVIYFEADKSQGESRAKLYDRFVKRWQPVGYRYRKLHNDKDTDFHAFIENEFYKKTYKDEE